MRLVAEKARWGEHGVGRAVESRNGAVSSFRELGEG